MDKTKLYELEKRVKLLEKKVAMARFNYYSVSQKSLSNSINHSFKFDFSTPSKSYLNFKTLVNCAIDGFLVEILVNNVKVYSGESKSGEFVFENVFPISGGENRVTVNVSGESEFSVNCCKLTTFGDLEYPKIDSTLSVINEVDKSIVMFLVNGVLRVLRYDGELTEKITLSDVRSASICKLGSDYLLTVVNQLHDCTVYLYSSEFLLKSNAFMDGDILSVCSHNGNPCSVFAVKGYRVYKYEIDSQLNFIVTLTQYQAKRIRSNPALTKYIIITDHADNGKIIKI